MRGRKTQERLAWMMASLVCMLFVAVSIAGCGGGGGGGGSSNNSSGGTLAQYVGAYTGTYQDNTGPNATRTGPFKFTIDGSGNITGGFALNGTSLSFTGTINKDTGAFQLSTASTATPTGEVTGTIIAALNGNSGSGEYQLSNSDRGIFNVTGGPPVQPVASYTPTSTPTRTPTRTPTPVPSPTNVPFIPGTYRVDYDFTDSSVTDGFFTITVTSAGAINAVNGSTANRNVTITGSGTYKATGTVSNTGQFSITLTNTATTTQAFDFFTSLNRSSTSFSGSGSIAGFVGTTPTTLGTFTVTR